MKLNKFDILFSESIRKRAIKLVGGCERCLTPKHDILKDDGKLFPAWKQLQTSHFWGRVKKAVRWDEDNAVGLCGACHLYFTAHPAEHTRWYKEHLGEQAYDLLEARAHIPQKPDEKALEIYLKSKIKELEDVLETSPDAPQQARRPSKVKSNDILPRWKRERRE